MSKWFASVVFVCGALFVVVMLPDRLEGQSAATCDGKQATLLGTAGRDVLVGTKGPDVIVAGAGNDRINGMGGDDLICAGPGNDVVRGGWGSDLIWAGGGDDVVRAGPGADFVHAGRGRDNIWGGRGPDILRGGPAGDTIRGGPGFDALYGDLGNDTLQGGLHRDFLDGGGGRDVGYGGEAIDECIAERTRTCERRSEAAPTTIVSPVTTTTVAPVTTTIPDKPTTTTSRPTTTTIPSRTERMEFDSGDRLRSGNGKYEVVMQGDGNFVLYERSPRRALWSTRTHGNAGARTVMQGDGNLVVYSKSSRPLWNSGTHQGRATLVMQNDGNLVIYRSGSAVWASNTVQNDESVTVSFIENPFTCDGGLRQAATLRGFDPGETVRFTSPQAGGLLSGTASNAGAQVVRWQCVPADVGTSWTITARGNSSGKTLTFTLGSRRQDDEGGGGDERRVDRRPTESHVVTPSPESFPMEPQALNGTDRDLLDFFTNAALAYLEVREWHEARKLLTHYETGNGETVTIHLPDLIWEERETWAVMEAQLRRSSAQAYRTALLTSRSDDAILVPFASGWEEISLGAYSSDWGAGLGTFSVQVKGDLWLGPSIHGVRQIQVRYKTFMYDVYDFNPNGTFAHLKRRANDGLANEFFVIGDGTNTRFEASNTAEFDPWRLGLNW